MCHVFSRRPMLLGAILRDEYLTSAVSSSYGRKARELFSLPHHRPQELARKQVACVPCRKSRFRVWEADQSQWALLQGRLGLFISPSVIGENHVSDAFSEQQEILSKVAGEEVVVWRRENRRCFAKLGRNSDISLVLPVSKI